MDDCLKFLHSDNEAITLSVQLTKLFKKDGFYFTKCLSNSKEVLTKISQERNNDVILDLTKIGNDVQNVLVVEWYFKNDYFWFSVNINKKPWIRRGVSSVVISLFDPLGFAALSLAMQN